MLTNDCEGLAAEKMVYDSADGPACQILHGGHSLVSSLFQKTSKSDDRRQQSKVHEAKCGHRLEVERVREVASHPGQFSTDIGNQTSE